MLEGERFLLAYNFMLANEGNFVDMVEDRGGATRFGVSLAFLKSMFKNGSLWVDVNKDNKIDENDLLHLTYDQIRHIYFNQFWKPISKIKPLTLATKVFDMAVNCGVGQAIKLLQKALGVVVDGIIGKQTLSAIQNGDEKDIITKFVYATSEFYKNIVAKNSSQKVFLTGWLNRAKRLPYWDKDRS
jgi:lysozyme family protein